MDQPTQPQTERPAHDLPLVTLLRHNLWANLRLMDACAALDAGQLESTTAGTYGSIFDTLHHIGRAEQGYLIILIGRQPETRLRFDRLTTIAEIREQARITGEGFIAYAASVTPSDVGYSDDDEDENLVWPVPAGFMLNQVINHATEHRAQIMTILTQQGIEPPDLSGWAFLDDTVTVTPIPRPKPAA
jgi:uncharacterized damage-inducible protein DinB